MSSLARLLYVGWIREYRAALSHSFIEIGAPESQADRDFLAAREQMESAGVSNDGKITISAVGMQNATVRIAPGTLRELSEQQFVARIAEAVTALAEDHLAKVRELKVRYFT
jgi:hypothetical protein